MTTIKSNDSWCRQSHDAAAIIICIVHSCETTGAYFDVLKVGDDVVVHDEQLVAVIRGFTGSDL